MIEQLSLSDSPYKFVILNTVTGLFWSDLLESWFSSQCAATHYNDELHAKFEIERIKRLWNTTDSLEVRITDEQNKQQS